ncbi:MAG: SH3 domain-containing protein [Geminicoccaceae bacterium]
MKRPLLARLALSAFLLAASGIGAPVPAAGLAAGSPAEVAVSGGSRANLRAEPRVANGNIVGKLATGDAVTVLEATTANGRDWYRVRTTDGQEGWIAADLVRAGEAPPAPAPEPAPQPAPTPPAEPAMEPSVEMPHLDDWTRMVPRLLPAIDACLDIVSLPPAVVTRVFEVEPDMAGIRMRDPTGRRFECLILRRGGYPIRYDPLGDRLRPMPGDGNPIFTRAPGPAPTDPCLDTTPLLDPADGHTLGWRSFKKC